MSYIQYFVKKRLYISHILLYLSSTIIVLKKDNYCRQQVVIFVVDRLAEGQLWPSDDDDDDDGAYLGKKGRIQGHILGEITYLEFQNHKNVNKCIFRTLEQAGTNTCLMGCQTQILR